MYMYLPSVVSYKNNTSIVYDVIKTKMLYLEKKAYQYISSDHCCVFDTINLIVITNRRNTIRE